MINFKASSTTALSLLAFIFSMSTLLIIWSINIEISSKLTVEDGLIENLSAIFYAIGMVFSLVAVHKRKHSAFAWMWFVICLLCLGEETSWFQRFIGYSVPSVERLSEQSEFNLHNLKILESDPIFDGNKRVNQFSWQMLFTSQTLFTIGLGIYFLILPIGYMNRSTRSLLEWIDYPRPPLLFVLSMWTVLIFSFVLTFFSGPVMKQAVGETREMLYAFIVFLYLFIFSTE